MASNGKDRRMRKSYQKFNYAQANTKHSDKGKCG